ICQYLLRKDLARCVLVSKAWAGWFSPALWRDLDCRNSTPDILILTRHQEHIRTVRNIPMDCNRPAREQLACLRLQRLEINEMSSGSFRPTIRTLRLLERIPTLQRLHITLPLDLDHIHQQWMRTIRALPCLESLTLEYPRLVNGMVLLEVLQACRGLQYLSLTHHWLDEILEEEDEQEYKDAREAIRRMPPLRLCELSFSSLADVVEKNILQPLLERCPRMEKLHIADMCSGLTLEHLTKTLKENKLPELRHLIIGSYAVYDSPAQKIYDDLLSSFPRGLESFGFSSCVRGPHFQPLIPHHSRSLTRLEIMNTSISFSMLSDLMTGLPCLRIVKAEIDQGQYREDILPLNRDWKCVDMTNLQLDLGMWDIRFTITDPEWKESTEKACLDHVFSQVGKLKNLQVLNLGCDLNIYVSKHGYLKQLAGLKQLKILDLRNTLCAGLRKQEALWMTKNWPKLVQVNENGLTVAFKKTLRMKRPLIEIVFIEDTFDDDDSDDSDDSDDF
ncbi:hypothetical protein BGX34_009001, partial [Mortierella sp. NVP85]